MSRRQKIEWIYKNLPQFYLFLKHLIPNLIQYPLTATSNEIDLYNELISLTFKHYGYDDALIETLQF